MLYSFPRPYKSLSRGYPATFATGVRLADHVEGIEEIIDLPDKSR
jgi:hypothetical protein